jgi:uncharacterized protein YjiS (DUF1127 family)
MREAATWAVTGKGFIGTGRHRVLRGMAAVLQLVRKWHQLHADTRDLALMDHRQLRDIGISSYDAKLLQGWRRRERE